MIKRATLADIDQLAELFDQYRVFYEKNSDLQAAKKFLSERIEKNESVIFVSENEKSLLVGFTQLYPVFSSTRMQKMWLLNDLYVMPDFRGKGISKWLIEKAKEHCVLTASCGLMLETQKSNSLGNKLYPKTGFVLNTTQNFYFWEAS